MLPDKPLLTEVFTGRARPRHKRFSRALARLLNPGQMTVAEKNGVLARLGMAARVTFSGYRTAALPSSGAPYLIHQSLSPDPAPYIAEFDVPLGIHGYNVRFHRKSAATAKELMEKESLRVILVFSEWAKRSFELHYGPEVGNKCKVIYPLASDSAHCSPVEVRAYDFTFISTQFRIKSGPEAVRAFTKARGESNPKAKMCVVTNLTEAKGLLGNLGDYPGVEWRQADLSEDQVAGLLADTRCLIHPALAESFGVVVLEALAAGCAVISTDFASFPELVLHEKNGLMIQPPISAVVGDAFITEYGNAQYFSDYLNTLSLHGLEKKLSLGMIRFLSDDAWAKKMMSGSFDHYLQSFAEPVWAEKMKTVLSEAFPEYPISKSLS